MTPKDDPKRWLRGTCQQSLGTQSLKLRRSGHGGRCHRRRCCRRRCNQHRCPSVLDQGQRRVRWRVSGAFEGKCVGGRGRRGRCPSVVIGGGAVLDPAAECAPLDRCAVPPRPLHGACPILPSSSSHLCPSKTFRCRLPPLLIVKFPLAAEDRRRRRRCRHHHRAAALHHRRRYQR